MLLLLHHLYVVHGSSDHFQCKFHSVRILHTHLQAVGYSLSEGHSMTLMCRNVNIYLSGRNLQDLNSQRNSVLSLPIHTVFQVQNTHGTLRLLIHNLEHCCLFLYWNYFPYCYYLSYCLMSWENYSCSMLPAVLLLLLPLPADGLLPQPPPVLPLLLQPVVFLLQSDPAAPVAG